MSGDVVAITGAFGALGRAVVEHFQRKGWRIAAIDSAPTPAAYAETFAANDLLIIDATDLSDSLAATASADRVVARFGRLDALVNLAGAFRWERVEDGESSTWEFLNRTNVMTAVHMCRAAIPHLKSSACPRIVNVGANAALKATGGMAPYTASKAAVHRLTEALAEELKAHRIGVNAVLPSIIDTPANRRDMPDAMFSDWVQPKELADVIGFLASQQASAITGALLPVIGRV